MHSAPSVSYPVGRSSFAGALALVLWLTAATAIAGGWVLAGASHWLWTAAAALVLAVGLCAAWNWWRAPAGALAWDGEAWSWSSGSLVETGAPQVSLDLQRRLLIRWEAGTAVQWLWLEQARRAERWDDLRRAVYSRARLAAPRTAAPPAANP